MSYLLNQRLSAGIVIFLCLTSVISNQQNKFAKLLQRPIIQVKNAEDVRTAYDPNQFDFEPIKQAPMQISKVLNIGDGNKAWVIDNAVAFKDFMQFKEHVRSGDTDFTFAHQNFSKLNNQSWNAQSAPWIREMNLTTFRESKVWKRLQPFVEEILGKKVNLQYSEIDFIRCLDPMKPMTSPFCGANKYILSFFVTDTFKLNSYGQLSFYAMSRNPNMSNNSQLEVTETVHPHGFRATLWPACHTVLFRAPSVNFFQHLMLLHVVMTTDLNSDEVVTSPASFASNKITAMQEFGNFKFLNEDRNRVIDYGKHLTRTLYDGTKNRPIYIFDDLFTLNELIQWRSHLCKANAHLNGFDAEPSESHDNVQWMKSLSPEKFLRTSMWPRLQSFMKYVDNSSNWFPYDVALNYIRAADHTRIHPDARNNEEEFTLLLYLSEGLTPNEYGETAWVVMKKDDGVLGYIGRGGEVYETIAAVAPKFGRLVAFRNNIEHSAHPPSSLYLGGRFSFAVKVAKNRRLAYIKRLYELMSDWSDQLSSQMQILMRQLMYGKHDNPLVSKLSDDFIEQLFQKLTKESSDIEEGYVVAQF
nr:uncharacterized protein LOC100183054 isoform X2 [Ciona intestinalis]|eukprot:XP_018667142.1 uncharacterized protein LOC100183054 isoform X2 [Ciona intestinalis]